MATSLIAAVSFAKTPLDEIAAKATEIRALGWEEIDRGNPWAVSYRKDIGAVEPSGIDAELRRVMGDYWLTAAEVRELLAK